MASNKTSTVTEARRRAREAKAALDAERREHEQRVEAGATDYYVAVGNLEELRAQMHQHQVAADQAVVSLLDLGETADRVAKLTGLSTRDVRRIKREHGTDAAPVGDAEVTPDVPATESA